MSRSLGGEVELRRALAYPKIRKRLPASGAAEFISLLRKSAVLVPDPTDVPRRSTDRGDDYLPALAESAVLVSGDRHLLALAGELPAWTPRELADALR